MEWYFEYG
jgi:type I protein arginine methyltransferase